MSAGDITHFEAILRGWLGTPFVDGAAVRGQGADCVGLLEGVRRDAFGTAPLARQTPGPDLLTGVEKALQRRLAMPCFGDVLLFARDVGGRASHAGILSCDRPGAVTHIHAHWSQGVVESRFGRWWQARLVGVFFFEEARAWHL